MPAATRLTLTSNANQSLKSPVLFAPNPDQDAFTCLLATAKSKLRLKKPLRLFLPGGEEVLSSAGLLAVLRQDLIVLVSSGEPYIGSTGARPPKPAGAVTVLANNTYVDALSVSQLNACAALPGIISAVGLPDLHPGTKFPIGCAFVSNGYIHPPLIGSDIGCGMAYYRLPTSLGLSDPQKAAQALTGLEGPWRDRVARQSWLGDASSGDERVDESIGTIGAGNHFAELQVVEKSPFPNKTVKEGDVLLLVHSGSRGFGKSVLEKFYNPEKKEEEEEGVSLSIDSPIAQEYLVFHDKACTWGKKNRDLIAARFMAKLEPGGGWDDNNVEDLGTKIAEKKLGDVVHNCVVPTEWLPGEKQTTYYLHRKGAAPTVSSPIYNTLPFLPLPGSRGTPTLLLQPLFNEANNYGTLSALSSAHGAGRVMSRAKANAMFRNKEESSKPRKGRKGANHDEDFVASGGSVKQNKKEVKGWVICDEKDLFWEESPGAYKDVESVAKDLLDAGVVGSDWAVCTPRITYKLRKE